MMKNIRAALKIPRHLLVCLAIALPSLTGSITRAQVAGAIAVYPENSSLEFGMSRQFSAYVPISPNTIIWLVNDIPGGNSVVGTITANGLYQAPEVIPMANIVSIKAQSTAFPSSVGSATLTITRKYPWLWGVSPSPLQVGNYSVSFNGANFAPDSKATANGIDLPTTFVSSTKLIATGNVPSPGTIKFAVRQPGPGALTGNIVSVQVNATVVTVAVAPVAPTIPLGTSQTFTATVSGSANTAVTWSVNGTVGGSAADGTISPSGLYAAPSVLPPGPVTVRATSVANPSVFAQATVTFGPPPPPVIVAVNPPSTSVQVGAGQAFTATVTGSANTAVTWSVNGIVGGSTAVGIITGGGLYTAPATVPASNPVTIRATSAANPSSFGQATVTVTPPVTVSVAPAVATVQAGSSQSFQATVTGSANTAVTWSVNGTVGGSVGAGTITSAGVYTAPNMIPAPNTVTIRATSVASTAAFGQAQVTLSSIPPATVWLSGARFLEQSSFGPTPATLAKVQQMGIDAYLQEQFTLPETPIFTPPDNSMGALRQWALYNYSVAPDQLRQRVAYALSQIIVTSAAKLIYPDEMLPWLRLLSKHAFGNYRELLRDITMCPSMGKYLDLANSMKPGMAGGANENYARELMQLFTIGLWQMNPDGSLATDANSQPISTYNQETVRQVSLALTGWTYATAPGAVPRIANWEYFGAPMETRQQSHDTSSKTYLGCTTPAGQTVEQDLESLLDCLMTHPNTAPFIATRLIRSLVKSNPTGGYIQRVANVFIDNGAGVRGDLKAVITAVLMDAEARQDTPSINDGRLKDTILHVVGFLRALNGKFGDQHQLTYLFDYMSQSVLNPASVFSWFSPLYHVPKSPLFGPEFQIYSPTEAVLRGNLFHWILYSTGTDVTIDLSPFQAYGNDMPALVEAANQRLLYGRMPAAMKQVLIDAASPGYDAKTRIETVLYLTALSGQYAVQH